MHMCVAKCYHRGPSVLKTTRTRPHVCVSVDVGEACVKLCIIGLCMWTSHLCVHASPLASCARTANQGRRFWCELIGYKSHFATASVSNATFAFYSQHKLLLATSWASRMPMENCSRRRT